MAAVQAGARDPRVRALLSTRTPSGTVIAEGVWAHRLLLDVDAAIETFVFCPALLGRPALGLAEAVARKAIVSLEVSPKTYTRISNRAQPSGLASLVRLPHICAACVAGRRARPGRRCSPHPRYSWLAGEGRIAGSEIGAGTRVLVADGIEYATNLGALIRVVDASGAQALLLTNRQARLEHPEVFTASRGTLLTTPVIDFGEPGAAAAWLKREGFRVRLALPEATGDFREALGGDRPTAIVVGSEGRGVSEQWRAVPHQAVSIPMRGRADSLNVAVAAGVLLFAN